MEIEGSMAEIIDEWFLTAEWKEKRKFETPWGRQEQKRANAAMEVDSSASLPPPPCKQSTSASSECVSGHGGERGMQAHG